MLEEYSKIIPLRGMYFKPLNSVINYDAQYGSDNLRLLDVYLNNDRNISDTAKIMNLHRNSVVYRIKRIESLIGVPLDDSELRLRILISLKVLRMLGLYPGSGKKAIEKI